MSTGPAVRMPRVFAICSCGSKQHLDFCRRFADGLSFVRCATCRRKGAFTVIHDEDLTREQREIRKAFRAGAVR